MEASRANFLFLVVICATILQWLSVTMEVKNMGYTNDAQDGWTQQLPGHRHKEWSRAMTTTITGPANGRETESENTYRSIIDEFVGFLANPAALKRGGAATQAARNQKMRGTLLDRMAQLEINRFWRAEIAREEHK